MVTVLDDYDDLRQLLPALDAQVSAPAEMILVDGGSRDGSLQFLRSWKPRSFPMRVISCPGVNIAAGRNVGVAHATSGWIACTDAGCRPHPAWLQAIEDARDGVDLIAGVYLVAGETPFEEALAIALYPSVEELREPQLPWISLLHGLAGRRFQISHATGRSMAFSYGAWKNAGGFPEHVYAGEDVSFSSAVLSRGYRGRLVPGAAVSWRPRGTWRANARMYMAYARGDIRTGNPLRHVGRTIASSAAPLIALRVERKDGSRSHWELAYMYVCPSLERGSGGTESGTGGEFHWSSL